MRKGMIAIILLPFLLVHGGNADSVPTPESVLGFQPGADYHLANWEQIVRYFHQVDTQSDRVFVEEIGRSTEDHPYILATISSPDTLRDLGRYKAIQQILSHPGGISPEDKQRSLEQCKTVILVTCAIHSNEIASSQMAMELLYELAARQDSRVEEILANTIILLAPSVNPDGIDKVVGWYERTRGKPWEGSGMPWLYQKYCGHDDNRDWFMLTQKETQILTRVLYEEWFPCITYDIHQMGNEGSRFFIPPFYDPVNPHVDPLIHETLKLVGGAMAAELSSEGKRGVISNAMYDNWWNGGNRTTPYRHNMIGILTEAASPRIASPIFQNVSNLTGHTRGLPEYRPQVNFADPWPGGWWRLRDVVEYEKTACYAIFTLAARYRDFLNRNYMALGEKALRLGREEPPYAYLIPQDQRDLPTAVHMLDILRKTGVEIQQADRSFIADQVEYPTGTYMILAEQPYRNHILDLLEPQEYPDRKLYPGGPAEPPYDVAGWTLSYQMGVNVIRVDHPFSLGCQPVVSVELPPGDILGEGTYWISSNTTNNDFILLNRALKRSIPVSSTVHLPMPDNECKEETLPGKLYYAPRNPEEKNFLRSWVQELGLQLSVATSVPLILHPLKPVRLALYQPWTANIDEGWTRFVLEQYEFEYTSLHNAEICAGDLRSRYDVIILPDASPYSILNGQNPNTTEPEFIGGIGEDGVMELRKFVAEGGRLLCLDSSCLFAIPYFDLPVRNALGGLKSEEFYCPGSVLQINLDPEWSIAYGMDRHAAAYFRHSYAFDLLNEQPRTTGISAGHPRVIASYDKTLPLLSGWLLGSKYLADKAAIVSVPYGQGKVILYGFPVQHRGQPYGTFRLLFNGIVAGEMD